MKYRRFSMRSLFWLLIVVQLPALAQAPEPTLRSTVNEVLLDVVVRDKKARIIRDLRPEEVQVLEDGVPQKLAHFSFFDGHATPAAPAETPAAPATAPAPPAVSASYSASRNVQELRDISVVSVVVANLDQQGRKVTLDAMRDFVKEHAQPNTYIGVFWLGRTVIRPVQPYTNDPDAVAVAMQKAVQGVGLLTGGPGQGLGVVTQWEGEAGDSSAPGGTSPAVDTSTGNGPAQAIENLMSSQWVDEMHQIYQDSAQYLSQLHTLVKSQAAIPGRKVVLLFSSGLPIHPDTVEVFNTVISTANRSNVSFYAIDTKGFGSSDLSNSRRMLAAAARSSMRQQMAQANGRDMTVTPDEVMAPQVAEASVRANNRENLGTLAEGTGGALLSTSMDLPKMLGRALEDVQSHYELSYSPKDTSTDGSFRKVEIKVSRPGAVVFARNGYYALPFLNERQIYPFEIATLKAINTKPAPAQFSFHSDALQFRPGQAKTQFSFAFEVPIAGLSVTEEKPSAKVHVDVTALIKDEKGQVVQKISRDIPYQVPLEKINELKRGVVTFTAPFVLPPGRYTMEIAALDRESMKASVRRSVLVVPQGAGLSMSDVVLVRRVDAVQEFGNAADPLQAKGGKVTPELSGSTSQKDEGAVRFYATAYPPAPVDAPVEMNMAIARDGQLVVRAPATEVPPEASGAVPVLVGVPREKLPPGQYEAQITFRYKGQSVSNVTAFSVAQE